MSSNDSFDENEGSSDLPQDVKGTMASLVTECARLREDLALSRRELAQVRLRQEDNEERLATLSMAEAERDQLARLLARHLSDPPRDSLQIGGLRGWLARRMLAIVLRSRKKDPLLSLIENSSLFDAGWYLRTYIDVAEAGECPALHYLRHGAAEGRGASPEFDTAFYLTRYPDVKESGVNPLVHYLQCGQREGRLNTQPLHERITDASGFGAPVQP